MAPRAASHASPTRDDAPQWVFGYGSLIYKADFPFLERHPARLAGWARRFWQGSHDHRGTPEAPGRVVTLVRAPAAVCRGVAYQVEPAVFAHLDHREKNGYARRAERLRLDDGREVDGVVYVADTHNPAWLGGGSDADLARHIAAARGPSGANRDYLVDLAQALRELGEEDAHVFALERALLALGAEATHG